MSMPPQPWKRAWIWGADPGAPGRRLLRTRQEPARPERRESGARDEETTWRRAARLYEAASRLDSAEEVYAKLVDLDPSDRSAAQALVRVKKTLGKYEELIESLLEQSESSESSTERAEHWGRNRPALRN